MCAIVAAASILSADASSSHKSTTSYRHEPPVRALTISRLATSSAFQQRHARSLLANNNLALIKPMQNSVTQHYPLRSTDALHMNKEDDVAPISSSSFLSTSKSTVNFGSSSTTGNAPSNLSPIDQLILTLTSDKTSLLLGSIGILLMLVNRLISFPEDAMYEASRSRIDLLGVFAAGSVLLNGISKLDVESAVAERVVLEGVNSGEGNKVIWNTSAVGSTAAIVGDEKFQSTVEWALSSFLKCSSAQTAILLTANPRQGRQWAPLATAGILPLDSDLQASIPESCNTPILDRMLRDDDAIKGGSVGGTEVPGAKKRKGPKESYLPTLQALPGKVEFTYLPLNAQEALILPVLGSEEKKEDGWYYAVVLGGDTAKSFAPRDIAWCKEIGSWVGELA